MIVVELHTDTEAQLNKKHILLKLANADSYVLNLPVEQAIAILLDPDADRPPRELAALDIGHPTAYKIQNKLTDLLNLRVDMDLKASLTTVLELYYLGILTTHNKLPLAYKISTQAHIMLATTTTIEPLDQLLINLARTTDIPTTPVFLNHPRPKTLKVNLPQTTFDKLVQIGHTVYSSPPAEPQDAGLDYILLMRNTQ